MSKVIKMLSTAAGPDRVLHAGRVYRLPNHIADELLAPWQPPLAEATETDPLTGVVRRVMRPMDLASRRFAELVTDLRNVKIEKLPLQPDPGDVQVAPDEDPDDFESLDE